MLNRSFGMTLSKTLMHQCTPPLLVDGCPCLPPRVFRGRNHVTYRSVSNTTTIWDISKGSAWGYDDISTKMAATAFVIVANETFANRRYPHVYDIVLTCGFNHDSTMPITTGWWVTKRRTLRARYVLILGTLSNIRAVCFKDKDERIKGTVLFKSL